MRIFVTGGTGFLGSHFLNVALKAGLSVVAIRRPGSTTRIPLPQEPDWVEGFLADDWASQLERCSTIVHLASHGVSPQPTTWEDAMRFNLMEPLRLARRGFDIGISYQIACGSCLEYGLSADRFPEIPLDAPLEPLDAYSSSKAAFSLAFLGLARERGRPACVARPFHFFGDGQHPSNFWPALRTAALSGKDFPMTPGEQVRDYMPVEEVAESLLRLVVNPPEGQAVRHIASGRPTTLRSFAEKWWKAWGARGMLQVGAIPYRTNEIMRYVPSLANEPQNYPNP